MFPSLPRFAEATDEVRAALLEVGKQGGIMDANDDLGAGPKALIVTAGVNGNPTSSNPNGTNPVVPFRTSAFHTAANTSASDSAPSGRA
jgi:hypothetical protein